MRQDGTSLQQARFPMSPDLAPMAELPDRLPWWASVPAILGLSLLLWLVIGAGIAWLIGQT
jgi:hypothetical protein